MIILYWISRGFTEGWKWSNKPFKSSHYHLVRLAEVLTIIGAVLFYENFWHFIGQNLVGVFIYERILMKLSSNKYFKDDGEVFDIGVKIKRYHWQDIAILFAGLILMFI